MIHALGTAGLGQVGSYWAAASYIAHPAGAIENRRAAYTTRGNDPSEGLVASVGAVAVERCQVVEAAPLSQCLTHRPKCRAQRTGGVDPPKGLPCPSSTWFTLVTNGSRTIVGTPSRALGGYRRLAFRHRPECDHQP